MLKIQKKLIFIFTRTLFIIAFASLIAFGQTAVRELFSGQTIEREMTGAETHRYKLDLKKDEFFQVRVEQKGVDVALKLTDASGKTLATMDSPNGTGGAETLSFITEKTDDFILEVSGFDAGAKKGIYVIKREASRTATSTDGRRVAAEKAFVEGITAQNTAGQGDIAAKKLEEALKNWQELEDDYLIQLTELQIIQINRAKIPIFDAAVKLFNQGTAESYKAALPMSQEAGSQFLEIGDKANAGISLALAGSIAKRLGDNLAALKFQENALLLFRSTKNKKLESATLGGIGSVYAELGEIQKALEYLNKSLPLSRSVGDKTNEAVTLNNIGGIYSDLGEKQKALEYYNQALPIFSVVGDKTNEAVTLSNIGGIYSNLGEKQKALEYYNQALPIFRIVGNKAGEATTLNNIGSVYLALDKLQEALKYFRQALPTTRATGDKSGEARILNNIGAAYDNLGEKQKALEYYNQSLSIARAISDKSGEARTLSNIMMVWESIQNSRVAVFYGKQSVNKYQELRQSIKGLDKEIQKTYLKSVEDTYRKLADLLIGQGNFAQAEQILTMLKQEEYFEFVRRDAGEIDKLGERVPLDEKEKALIERYAGLADKITVIGQEFIRLDDKKRQLASEGATLSPEEQKRYDELEKQLETASTAFQLFLNKELVAELGGKKTGEIEIDRKLQAKLRQWGEGTVALYTIAGADRYRVVLTTATAQVDGKTEIKVADLNKKVFAFRDALQNPKIDPRPLGKELYDILIKPVEKELAAAGAKTLIWSFDGTLRYIPLAALSPDGKKYLVEQWQNVVITTRTRDSISDSNTDWEALGLGVSEAQIIPNPDNNLPKIPFSTLAETERELTAIVKDEKAIAEKGILPGRRYMNGDFTSGIFKESMAMKNKDGSRKFNVVHIASHFRLGSSDSNSFILLGDGQILTLEEIRRSPAIDFSSVELVTLSACNTAFADDTNGREVDSLASVIQAKNGKAVLATLWKVADQSTSHFMIEFYRLRKENPKLTKAEAIQSAQKAMLSAACKDGKECYTHPYYWSPFILIGNWR